MAVSVRPATVADVEVCRAIVRAAYAHYIARIGREPGPIGDDYEALIRAGRVHLAERDGVVRGLLVLIPQGDAMLLDNVAVSPEAQGSGLGRRMLAFAERAALEARRGSTVLYTNAAMTENIGLYARHGYVETRRVEEKGLRRVYMRKRLV